MTNTMILKSLSFLVWQDLERRKASPPTDELEAMHASTAIGRQHGYMECLRHFMGESEDVVGMCKAVATGESFLDFIDKIYEDKIHAQFEDMQGWSEEEQREFVEEIVEQYISDNISDIMKATQFI